MSANSKLNSRTPTDTWQVYQTLFTDYLETVNKPARRFAPTASLSSKSGRH